MTSKMWELVMKPERKRWATDIGLSLSGSVISHIIFTLCVENGSEYYLPLLRFLSPVVATRKQVRIRPNNYLRYASFGVR